MVDSSPSGNHPAGDSVDQRWVYPPLDTADTKWTPVPSDEDLLIECDALLSLVRYRESSGLSEQTIRDIDALLPSLRRQTDQIIDQRREAKK